MIFIRHGHKEYENGRSSEYRFDPPLTTYGQEQAYICFKNLLDQHGPPSRIVASPFRRTRQTADIAQTVILERLGYHVEINYDNGIREYLGNHHTTNPDDFEEQTFNYLNDFNQFTVKSKFTERWGAFIKRLKNAGPQLQPNVWYITHGLVIQQLAQHYFKKSIQYPNELEPVILSL